jgi:hypothetical protein
MQDLLAKQRMTRLASHQVGGCIARCMGIDSTNALSVITYLTDQKYGTEYHKRFENWLRDFQTNDRTSCCAQTDVKGNRPWRPHEQKTSTFRRVERRAMAWWSRAKLTPMRRRWSRSTLSPPGRSQRGLGYSLHHPADARRKADSQHMPDYPITRTGALGGATP